MSEHTHIHNRRGVEYILRRYYRVVNLRTGLKRCERRSRRGETSSTTSRESAAMSSSRSRRRWSSFGDRSAGAPYLIEFILAAIFSRDTAGAIATIASAINPRSLEESGVVSYTESRRILPLVVVGLSNANLIISITGSTQFDGANNFKLMKKII